MDIHGFFTQKGLLLAAKLAAGSTLKYTRACAGAAETALSASALSQIRQTLSMGAPRRDGGTAVLPVTLEAGMAGSAYTLREVGLYAQDPDEGEILYKVYRLTEPVSVAPSSRLVLRFYLEETVSQDLNVTVVRASAGLLTEADLDPVREKVEAASVPVRTINVEASQLQAAIDTLPRLLTEWITLNTSGTLDAEVELTGFYGSGAIAVVSSLNNFTLRSQMRIQRCSVPVYIQNLAFQERAGAFTGNAGMVSGETSSHIYIWKCGFTGLGKDNSVASAVRADSGTNMRIRDVRVSGCRNAALVSASSLLSVEKYTTADFQENAFGAYVWNGGIVLLGSGVPAALGGLTHRKLGGMIAVADGAPL